MHLQVKVLKYVEVNSYLWGITEVTEAERGGKKNLINNLQFNQKLMQCFYSNVHVS